MPLQDITGDLLAVLEEDRMANFAVLEQLSRRQPLLVRVGSLSPLQALVAFEPTGPGMHHVALLWGREPAACGALLRSLAPGNTYWLVTPDQVAASAVRGWACEIAWEGEELCHSVTPDAFRPAPLPDVRPLTAADLPALATARPQYAQAPARGLREPRRLFGIVSNGRWLGDALCAPAYKDVWVIGNLLVDKRHRRRGIGKAIVTACVQHVFANGGRPVYQCDSRNVASTATCEAVGFNRFGTEFKFTARAPGGPAA